MPPFILPTFNILSLLKNNIAQENKQNDNEKKDSKKKSSKDIQNSLDILTLWFLLYNFCCIVKKSSCLSRLETGKYRASCQAVALCSII
jgi:hypothetical protein